MSGHHIEPADLAEAEYENLVAPNYAGHSGAQWRVASDPAHYDTMTDVVDARGDLVACMCGADVAAMEANARLIAAAPDLLAEIKWVRANLREVTTSTIEECLDAAIAKAEGRQS